MRRGAVARTLLCLAVWPGRHLAHAESGGAGDGDTRPKHKKEDATPTTEAFNEKWREQYVQVLAKEMRGFPEETVRRKIKDFLREHPTPPNPDPMDDGDWSEFHGYYLAAGCQSMAEHHAGLAPPKGRFEDEKHRAGQVQCCNVNDNPGGPPGSVENTFCSRSHSGKCFGKNPSALFTFGEAVLACSLSGMRLCTRRELETEDSLGCCGTECGLDRSLIWTSTHEFSTQQAFYKKEYYELEQEIIKLKEQHMTRVDEARNLNLQVMFHRRLQNLNLNKTAPAEGKSSAPDALTDGDMQELNEVTEHNKAEVEKVREAASDAMRQLDEVK